MDTIRDYIRTKTAFIVNTPTEELSEGLLAFLKILGSSNKGLYDIYRYYNENTCFCIDTEGDLGYSEKEFFETDPKYRKQTILILRKQKD